MVGTFYIFLGAEVPWLAHFRFIGGALVGSFYTRRCLGCRSSPFYSALPRGEPEYAPVVGSGMGAEVPWLQEFEVAVDERKETVTITLAGPADAGGARRPAPRLVRLPCRLVGLRTAARGQVYRCWGELCFLRESKHLRPSFRAGEVLTHSSFPILECSPF